MHIFHLVETRAAAGQGISSLGMSTVEPQHGSRGYSEGRPARVPRFSSYLQAVRLFVWSSQSEPRVLAAESCMEAPATSSSQQPPKATNSPSSSSRWPQNFGMKAWSRHGPFTGLRFGSPRAFRRAAQAYSDVCRLPACFSVPIRRAGRSGRVEKLKAVSSPAVQVSFGLISLVPWCLQTR